MSTVTPRIYIHATNGKTLFNGYFQNLHLWCFVCTRISFIHIFLS